MQDLFVIAAMIYIFFGILTLGIYLVTCRKAAKDSSKLFLPLHMVFVFDLIWIVGIVFQVLSSERFMWLVGNLISYTGALYIAGSLLLFSIYIYIYDRSPKRDMGTKNLWYFFLAVFTLPLSLHLYLAYNTMNYEMPNLWVSELVVKNTGYGLFHEIHGPLWFLHMGVSVLYTLIALGIIIYILIRSNNLRMKIIAFFVFVAVLPVIIIGMLIYVVLTPIFAKGLSPIIRP